MTGDRNEFVKRAAETVDEFEVDELCFQWLGNALIGNGTDGEIGLKFLEIVKELMP